MLNRKQLIERLIFSFVNFRKGIGRGADSNLQKLPLAQSEAFFVIGYAKSISVGDLARHLSVTPGAATQLVEPLVAMGYVQRIQDSSDRRTVNLTLSEAGEKYRHKAKAAKIRYMTDILEDLSDEELNTLTELLEKVSVATLLKKEKEK